MENIRILNAVHNSLLNTSTACPSCGSLSAHIIADKDGKTNEKLITVSCNQCGLGRIDPLPTDQELADWYANHYRQLYKSSVQPALRHVLRAGRNALGRWNWLSQNSVGLESLQNRQTKRSLDIGSSSGEFVFLMHLLGFEAKGIEPHVGYATYAREMLGVDTRNGTLQHCLSNEEPGSLDVISMFHVLEHLPEPVSALRTMGSKLKPEGLIYIEVPNALRLCSPHYMFFRAHTLYFTGPTLRNLLEVAGFKIVSHNPDNSDNIKVLAQFVGATNVAFALDGTHPLVSAQQARRWGPYLLQQLQDGQPMRRWRIRQEEKKTSALYANAKVLLQDLYKV